jgi:hypothetical protein
MTEQVRPNINEITVEIRFAPKAEFLDLRGSLAQKLSKELNLSEWRIDPTRVDVFDKIESRRFFISHANAGAILNGVADVEVATNQLNDFMKMALTGIPFHGRAHIRRIGVRTKFANNFHGSFEQLRSLYKERYVTVPQSTIDLFESDLDDIGVSLNFVGKDWNMNTMTGPMDKDQVIMFMQFQKRNKDLPEVVAYFEADKWSEPNAEMPWGKISDQVSNFLHSNWQANKRLCDVVMEPIHA